jgi:hypothetical protein
VKEIRNPLDVTRHAKGSGEEATYENERKLVKIRKLNGEIRRKRN